MTKKKTKKSKKIKRFSILIWALIVILFLTSLVFDKQILSFTQNIKEKYGIDLGITFFENHFLFFYGGVILLQVLFLALDRKIKKKWKKIPILFISLLVVEAVVLSLKVIISRQRPSSFLSIFSEDQSFPSGHTAFAFTVLPFLKNKTLRWAWFLIATIIGLSRVWQNVHYLSDVIAGAVVGYVIPFLILKITSKDK